jgi:hypothetical protein
MSEARDFVAYLESVAASAANLLDNPGIVAANNGARVAYGV